MEELDFNNTSWSFNNMNYTSYNNVWHDPRFLIYMNWITICIGLLLNIIVTIAVFLQVKKGQDPPIYIINLIVSDLIQFCARIPLDISSINLITAYPCLSITYYCGLVSVGFMMCISCERYLVIAKPLWYRFRRNVRTYVVVCIVVWILPFFFTLFIFLSPHNDLGFIFIIVFFLLPFPLFIFFLVGTIKALSGALNVPEDEKRRIAAIQVVVLIIYTLLYLPIILWIVCQAAVLGPGVCAISFFIALVCGCLSPLANTTLYLFSRKSIMDKFLASICSCKLCNSQETSSTDHESNTVTNTETV